MGEHTEVQFRRDEEGSKCLAIFLAQLIREGVTYRVDNSEIFVRVTLTGGF